MYTKYACTRLSLKQKLNDSILLTAASFLLCRKLWIGIAVDLHKISLYKCRLRKSIDVTVCGESNIIVCFKE